MKRILAKIALAWPWLPSLPLRRSRKRLEGPLGETAPGDRHRPRHAAAATPIAGPSSRLGERQGNREKGGTALIGTRDPDAAAAGRQRHLGTGGEPKRDIRAPATVRQLGPRRDDRQGLRDRRSCCARSSAGRASAKRSDAQSGDPADLAGKHGRLKRRHFVRPIAVGGEMRVSGRAPAAWIA